GWVALLVEPLPHRRARLLHAVLDRVQALASAGARGVLHLFDALLDHGGATRPAPPPADVLVAFPAGPGPEHIADSQSADQTGPRAHGSSFLLVRSRTHSCPSLVGAKQERAGCAA